jgi:hypothetical protein
MAETGHSIYPLNGERAIPNAGVGQIIISVGGLTVPWGRSPRACVEPRHWRKFRRVLRGKNFPRVMVKAPGGGSGRRIRA